MATRSPVERKPSAPFSTVPIHRSPVRWARGWVCLGGTVPWTRGSAGWLRRPPMSPRGRMLLRSLQMRKDKRNSECPQQRVKSSFSEHDSSRDVVRISLDLTLFSYLLLILQICSVLYSLYHWLMTTAWELLHIFYWWEAVSEKIKIINPTPFIHVETEAQWK